DESSSEVADQAGESVKEAEPVADAPKRRSSSKKSSGGRAPVAKGAADSKVDNSKAGSEQAAVADATDGTPQGQADDRADGKAADGKTKSAEDATEATTPANESGDDAQAGAVDEKAGDGAAEETAADDAAEQSRDAEQPDDDQVDDDQAEQDSATGEPADGEAGQDSAAERPADTATEEAHPGSEVDDKGKPPGSEAEDDDAAARNDEAGASEPATDDSPAEATAEAAAAVETESQGATPAGAAEEGNAAAGEVVAGPETGTAEDKVVAPEPDSDGDDRAEVGAGPADGTTRQADHDGDPRTDAAPAERTPTEQAAMALITALMRLRGALASSKLPLEVVGADEARQQQKAMLDQLDDYILPRLVQLEAPVLAVVGGSTGAGKSTLVNTLVGAVVSDPGVLRPTTRSPVLVHNPVDAEWFTGERVLPGLARATGEAPGGHDDPGSIRLVAADTIPQGLAILDAPDIDSVVEANRELASQLLAAADLWLFVTTAARYADAVPWDFLKSAAERSTAVAVVLDRVPEEAVEDITGHLAQMLLERGLGDSPLFSIPESEVDDEGLLPAEVVALIRDWLSELAADAEARSAVIRRTLQGAVTAMTKKTPAFATAVRAQADTAVELRSNAEAAYERAVKDVGRAIQDGTMLRGEVLARWQEFVGTGELLKGLQTNVGRLRDKLRAALAGKPEPTRNLNDAVESGLESLLREHAEAAAERAEESWQSTVAGRQLLAAGERDLGRASREFPAEAGRAVRDWQRYVLDLVRKEGADKRSTARVLAYGVNGLGLALMVVIFASTAGITGAEIGVGAGTAVVGQKLLEAVFGDQAVRGLASKAREDLNGRVHALMDAEFARFLAVLDQHPVDPDAPRRLTEAARAVEDCT
ncbi:MAG TPA: AAA family ATPase, partial [Kribbella sp.]|nr:AAA family ATPase [Kribbella sp.]